MPGSGGEVTLLLARLREGSQDAASELIPLVYGELRQMARAYMQHERPNHTLGASALVHEAYMRLVGDESGHWQNRAHFFAIAAHTMRQVLLDCARRRHADKRGGANARKVDIDAELLIAPESWKIVIAIDEALERLRNDRPAAKPPGGTPVLRGPERGGGGRSDGHLGPDRETRMEIGQSLALRELAATKSV